MGDLKYGLHQEVIRKINDIFAHFTLVRSAFGIVGSA